MRLFLLGFCLCWGCSKGLLRVTKGTHVLSRFACCLDLVVGCVQVPLTHVQSQIWGTDPYKRSCYQSFDCQRECCSKQVRKSTIGGGYRWWMFILLLVRVGEARVPGPVEWSIGVCNPAGLMNKCHLFPLEEADVWLVAETHLTSSGVRGFRKGIRAQHRSPSWFVPGHPVKQRSKISDHGTWSGVGVLTKHACQALPHDWSPWAFESSRLLAFTSFVNHMWLSGVVMYGLPTGPTHPQAKARTNALVQEAVRRVLCMDGPRIFGGDFNHDLDELPALDTLYNHNFVEVQDLLFLQQGVSPKPTCKMKTRRDYLFISPELIPMFKGVEVNHTHWIDHASVIANFQGSANDLIRYPWPVPKPIPWSEVHDLAPGPPCSMDFENGCDRAYRDFWHQVEQHVVEEAASKGVRIPQKCLGRATRQQPLKIVGTIKPSVPGRRGEITPQYFGVSFLHKQWFRQLRRLQSFIRIAGVEVVMPTHVEHRLSLWHAILHSTGFKPTFAEWWEHRDLKECSEPGVPRDPPTVDIAMLLFAGLEAEVRALEKQLKAQHRGHACKTSGQSLASLYKAVKPDAPVPVDVLVSVKQAIIEHLDPADCAIELDRRVDWDQNSSFVVEGNALQMVQATEDKLYLETLDNLSVGQTVVQNNSCGKLDDLFQAFIDHWSKLWVRHSQVPRSQWDDILNFARSRLGYHQLPNLDLSIPLLRATAKSKKSTAAVGLDGVRRQDILSLSSNQFRGLQSIYHHAHATGKWPSQLVAGLVKSLAKVAQPTCVQEFRPISIFSMAYRVWSSAQSRYWLKQLEAQLDRMLCGNRAGYQAATLWRRVLEEVEKAYDDGSNLCGVIIDLTKAYNSLPRLPCLALALLIGVDATTVTAWSGALSQMTRRFWIQGSVSSPLGADRGFPEGCGLSCMAMLLLDQIWHEWVRNANHMAQPLSYVDNWEILCHDHQSLEATWNATLDFALALDLQVDTKKTCVWATSSACRHALKSGGFTVIHDGKDLGAHMVYSRQIRNSSQLSRFRSLLDFWPRLQKATGGFDNKIRVLRTAAWPRALHGVSATLIGRKHFHSLRSNVVKALNLQRPGLNPFVLCHLVGRLDPHLVAIVETIRSWRQVGNYSHQLTMLEKVDVGSIGRPIASLTSVLEQRLQTIGWRLDKAGVVHRGSNFQPVELVSHNWSELVWSVEKAWTSVVASQLPHRPSFKHFDKVDVEHTRAAVATYQPTEQGILRRILSGATTTNQHSCYWSSSGTDACTACGQKDSLHHRFWECLATMPHRQAMDQSVLEILPELPEVLTVHGWTLRSGLEGWFYNYLQQLDASVPNASAVPVGTVIDIFTDGSCLWPTESCFRLASWAVCLAGEPGQTASPNDTVILGSGQLSGLQQTAFRAELTALKMALSWVKDWAGQVRIWMDCQGVIDRHWTYARGHQTVASSAANGDLWLEVVELSRQVGCERVQILKVPAHEEVEDSTPEVLRWARFNNDIADNAARVSNLDRGPVFWTRWKQHADLVTANRHVASEIRRLQVNILAGWKVPETGDAVPERAVPREGRIFTMRWRNVSQLGVVPVKTAKLLGREFSQQLLQWWNLVVDWDNPQNLQWIAFAQLFLLFQLQSKHPGLVKKGRQWVNPALVPLLVVEDIGFRERSKWFRLCLQQLWKDSGFDIGKASTRPRSSSFVCHLGCTSIPVKQELLEQVEVWLSQHTTPILGHGEKLDMLPPIC